MCGIAGIMGDRPGQALRPSVARMLELLSHRGPDDEGIWEDGDVCLGHRRLSIIDLSPRGHQPMVDDGATVALTFNGEIYNYLELRDQLEREGVVFRSNTDTEVLLHGYRRWGDQVLTRLRGFFTFALWDRRRRRLLCARDPVGKKPLYYCLDGPRLIFASGVEAVVAALGARPKLNWPDLAHYLWTGYFSPGASVYARIRTLRAGHCLEAGDGPGSLREWPYAEVRFALTDGSGQDYGTLLRTCDRLIGRAVKRRLQSDVPVGVLLSGGVDSSLVTLSAAEHSRAPIRTFTAAFPGTAFDETRYARAVAERAGSLHTVTAVAMDDLPALLPQLVEAYGEPFGDDSAIPTFCLFRAIKPHVKVVLTGDGGDELFGGYRDADLFRLRQAMRGAVGLGNLVSERVLDGLLQSRFRTVREVGYAGSALRRDGADVFCSLIRGGWTARYRRQMLRPEVWRQTGGADVETAARRRFRESGRDDLERYLNMSLERLIQCFMVKVDRASMAHSLEARCPLLDGDLLAAVTATAPALLFRGGERKVVLKDLLDPRMGGGFSRRPKMGFTPPVEAWFREPRNAAWVEHRLTCENAFAYELLEPRRIRELLELHRRGYEQSGRLWKLLFLNEWFARFCGSGRVSTDVPGKEQRAATNA